LDSFIHGRIEIMTDTRFDVLGIGNAIVDVIAETSDDFLGTHDLIKGSMRLIDEDEAGRIYDGMGPGTEVSGGSAANTIAGVAALGGRGSFVGKVRDDQLGEVFAHDIRAQGVSFTTPAAAEGPLTARCMVLVTPDAQRTLNTFLGAAIGISVDDLDPADVAASKVTYLEGYLWDAPAGPALFAAAATAAASAGQEVAMTLSDPFCVDRHRKDFIAFIREHVDIVFANEDEVISLYEADSFDEAAKAMAGDVKLAALTRSEKGSVVVSGSERATVDAVNATVVDTTGAGDLYAAGFLYGYTNGTSLDRAARIGGICAAEVISHLGARPRANLQTLVTENLG
jgi:sugar/nucleoside kinase (ribokinase family)